MSTDDQIRRCYSTWSDNYYREYYGANAPYPPVHRDIIRDVLKKSGAKKLLDAGCGPASILRDLVDLKLERYGFDLTPEMVVEADKVLRGQGEPAGRVWEGSVLEKKAFQIPNSSSSSFDAVLCVGVLPHIPDGTDTTAFKNIRSALRPGGVALVEGRNQLFSLFSANRYSYEFFVQHLINAEQLRMSLPEAQKQILDSSLADLKSNFRMDQPPLRPGKGGQPGYDEVLSRTHNPLVVAEQFRQAGFKDVEILFYHFHCLPPYLGKPLGADFIQQSVAMENPKDWRGYFMASAFFVYGIAA